MEYFVYYDDGHPWMNARSFGDDRAKAQGFIKDKLERDPEKRNVSGCGFLSMLYEDGKEYEGPILVCCDCSIKSESACYEELCDIFVSSQ